MMRRVSVIKKIMDWIYHTLKEASRDMKNNFRRLKTKDSSIEYFTTENLML